jgi:hypothetical protein
MDGIVAEGLLITENAPKRRLSGFLHFFSLIT